jgi:hypothetical protein
VSHLYHLGAKRFYLDREKPLALSDEQSMRLTHLWEFDQEERLRFRDALTRRERELYRLTGEEAPRFPEIDGIVRDIERLRAERRLTFIRRVAEAASVLTEHQREMLKAPQGAP